MICYLIRHGKDDDTRRGGWSSFGLTDEGKVEIEKIAEGLRVDKTFNIERIYTSDLNRALETAEIISQVLKIEIIKRPQFREVNNGILAGMKNDLALIKYPGLFWNQLGWNEKYPQGESPCEFYERINNAWNEFSEEVVKRNKNAALVTHGGVINVILDIVQGRQYSNRNKYKHIDNGNIINLSYTAGKWTKIIN